MSMNQTPDPIDPGTISAPPPQIRHHRWLPSLVWLVPLVAALVGLSMLIHGWLSIGPQIKISFQSASGLEAKKTLVKYKDVAIGKVSTITLSDDHTHVIVSVDLEKSAEDFAREDSRFWVVRPRVGAGGVSGIDTVFSGAYIGVDKGNSRSERRTFAGLEYPPTVINGLPGRSFVLHSDNLGSLDAGSPVYYRGIQVGQVASFSLDKDSSDILLHVFVNAPYDRYVTASTRFWHASGVDVSLGADGLKLNTQSLATVLAGGIAFATPDGDATPAADQAGFALAKDQQTALSPPDGPAQYIELHFEQSLRGLSVDAPVEFLGINIGRVVSINLDYDPARERFPITVGTVIYPQRLGRVREKLPKTEGDPQQRTAKFISHMVDRGLRAEARAGNLLTGQLFIALEFMPNATKVRGEANARPISIPTVPGSFDKLQERLADIVGKMAKVPFDSIGQRLDDDLLELNKSLKQVNGTLLPEARETLKATQKTLGSADAALAEDAPLQQNLNQTLRELQRTSRTLRTVTDQLGRHPESLIRGRASDPRPPQPAPSKESAP